MSDENEWRPDIGGWSSDILPWYRARALELPRGCRVVEVGVYLGRSALFLATELVELGRDPQVWLVDPSDAHHERPWCQLLENVGSVHEDVRRAMRLMRIDSVRAARAFDDGSCDLVFIDADHHYGSVRDDIAAWAPKVRPGGIISGHDYYDAHGDYPGVQRAVRERFGVEGKDFQVEGSVWWRRMP
jgi:predicted O-methyltransferase YrrM